MGDLNEPGGIIAQVQVQGQEAGAGAESLSDML